MKGELTAGRRECNNKSTATKPWGAKILPQLRPSIVTKTVEYFAKVGVTVLKITRVVSVTQDAAGMTNVAGKATVRYILPLFGLGLR